MNVPMNELSHDASVPATARWNLLASRWIVEACLECGVDQFFLAPGSRCTPLTLAVAEQPNIQVVRHFDERGLAFAALGYGRATGRAAAVICTSGTAVANLLPAVVEASLDHVPLLLLTADRPPELRDRGANQTIDQVKIFQTYARWFADLPCPAADLGEDFWHHQIQQALFKSTAGPVHVNLMFREPFGVPSSLRLENQAAARRTPSTAVPAFQRPGTSPWTIPPGKSLVVAGHCHREEALAASRLAERLQAPFFSDISTGIRSELSPWTFARYDLEPPEVVIHVGQRIVTKRWPQFLKRHRPRHYLHLTHHSDYYDPDLLVTQTLVGPLRALCDEATSTALHPDRAYRAKWLDASQAIQQTIEHLLTESDELMEPWAARQLSSLLPLGHDLFLGNSLPIRDWDSFADWPSEHEVHVGCNRGASGIDGLIATGVGFARGRNRPTTIVLGDLSALHDLNSLSLVASSAVPITLIVMNNQGGGIFHFLPIASQTEHFEPYFVTPHDRSFEQAAAMFGLEYRQVNRRAELMDAYQEASHVPRSCLIEVRTHGPANAAFHRRVEQAVLSSSS